MRRWITTMALVALGACGGDSSGPSAPAQEYGTLFFRLDAQTCTGAGKLAFYVDGVQIGTADMAPGVTATFANQKAGQHIIGANELTAGGYTWPSATITIPPNGSYTQLLKC